MTKEELWAGLVTEGQDGAAKEGEGLSSFWILEARRVLAPLGIAFPMIFVFDAPVRAHVLGKLLGAMLAGVKAGDEVAHAGGVLDLSPDGLFARARDADDSLGEGQADGLGLDGQDPDFVTG